MRRLPGDKPRAGIPFKMGVVTVYAVAVSYTFNQSDWGDC